MFWHRDSWQPLPDPDPAVSDLAAKQQAATDLGMQVATFYETLRRNSTISEADAVDLTDTYLCGLLEGGDFL